jgi:hypothetical protein
MAFGEVYALLPGMSEWQFVPNPSGSEGRVESIAAAAEGGIWATHGDDLFRFGGPDVMLTIQLPEKCRIRKLTEKAGSVWGTGIECGLLQFDVSNATWVLHRPLRVNAVNVSTDGTLYALRNGPLGTGLYALGLAQLTRVTRHMWRVIHLPAYMWR